jgi:LysM repeat protein
VVGASIGPGASSQWIGADYLAAGASLGAFAGRIRWNNDAYYRRPAAWPNLGHDVSVLGGVRGSFGLAGLGVDAEYTLANRLNYLYQNRGVNWETSDDAVDVLNHTLRLTLSARPRSRRPAAPVPTPPAPVSPASVDSIAAPAIAEMEEGLMRFDSVEAGDRPEPAPRRAAHRVERGETVWGIARRYGVTVEALRRENGLTSDRIQPGQSLWIPPGS